MSNTESPKADLSIILVVSLFSEMELALLCKLSFLLLSSIPSQFSGDPSDSASGQAFPSASANLSGVFDTSTLLASGAISSGSSRVVS